jgi:hypothetical protein
MALLVLSRTSVPLLTTMPPLKSSPPVSARVSEAVPSLIRP